MSFMDIVIATALGTVIGTIILNMLVPSFLKKVWAVVKKIIIFPFAFIKNIFYFCIEYFSFSNQSKESTKSIEPEFEDYPTEDGGFQYDPFNENINHIYQTIDELPYRCKEILKIFTYDIEVVLLDGTMYNVLPFRRKEIVIRITDIVKDEEFIDILQNKKLIEFVAFESNKTESGQEDHCYRPTSYLVLFVIEKYFQNN